MGNVVKKVQCPECLDKSEDNLIIYDDGSGWCFACEYFLPSDENNTVKKGKEKVSKALTKEQDEEVKRNTQIEGYGYRGIRTDISKALGVRYKVDDDNEVVEQFYPATTNYELSGYKIRIHPKDFKSVGETGKDCELFMQFKFRTSTGTIIITGGECFKPDTEIMTDVGFVKFSELTKEHKVLQVEANNVSSFVTPTDYIVKPYNGLMVKLKGAKFTIDATENHNFVYENIKSGEWVKRKANEHVSVAYQIPLQTVFSGEGTGLTEDQIALTLAICADSKYDTRKDGRKYVHFGLMKERKIIRLKGILDRLLITYNSNTNTYANGKTYTTFNFNMPDYIKDKKIPREWIKSTTKEEKDFILSELRWWDGNEVKNRTHQEFTSKHLDEVTLIQELCVTSGKYSRIRKRSNQYGEWYVVSIHDSERRGNLQAAKKETYNYEGMVYCVTVPSGMIMVRIDGKTSIVGNCDSLSAFQILSDAQKDKKYDPIAVVSPTIGESGAHKQIQSQYAFFSQFKKIIVCMDNDKAGEEATQKIIKVLPRGKVYIMKMRWKDANEYLLAGEQQSFVNDFWNAKPYTPAGVYASTELYEAALERMDLDMISLPPFLKRASKMLGDGIVRREITTILAKTSIGKTTLMSGLTEHLALNEPNDVTGVLSLEADKGKFSMNLLSYHLGVPLHRMKKEERLEYLQQDDVKESIDTLYRKADGSPTLYVCDDRGSDWDQIKEKLLEMVISMGVTILIVDPYSDLLSGMSVQQQEEVATWFKRLMKEYGVTIVIISHVRKSSNTSEDGHITEDDAQGSSFLVKASGQTIALERDKQSEDINERNRTYVYILKNRDFSETGPAGSLYYDIPTNRLYDFEDWMKSHPVEENF